MKKLILILLSISVISCHTKETPKTLEQENYTAQADTVDFEALTTPTSTSIETLSEHDRNEYIAILMSVNSKIRADYANRNNNDFSRFNEISYKKHLSTLNSKKPNKMKILLAKMEKVAITGFSNTFTFCGASRENGYVFCDDTLCQGVEYFHGSYVPEKINEWQQQLPLKKCSQL